MSRFEGPEWEAYLHSPDDARARCPRCRHIDVWDEFDCIGATTDHVFCPKCGREVQAVDLDLEAFVQGRRPEGELPLFREIAP